MKGYIPSQNKAFDFVTGQNFCYNAVVTRKALFHFLKLPSIIFSSTQFLEVQKSSQHGYYSNVESRDLWFWLALLLKNKVVHLVKLGLLGKKWQSFSIFISRSNKCALTSFSFCSIEFLQSYFFFSYYFSLGSMQEWVFNSVSFAQQICWVWTIKILSNKNFSWTANLGYVAQSRKWLVNSLLGSAEVTVAHHFIMVHNPKNVYFSSVIQILLVSL